MIKRSNIKKIAKEDRIITNQGQISGPGKARGNSKIKVSRCL